MRRSSLLAAFVPLFALAAGATEAAPASTPASVDAADVGALPSYVDEGVLLDAVAGILARATEPTRVAVLVDDADATRRLSLERSLVRVLRDRRREEILTPALVRARLGDAGAADPAKFGGAPAAGGLAADHVLVANVIQAADGAVVDMKLLSTEKGAVVATARVELGGGQGGSTARVLDVHAATADLADVIAEAVERQGVAVTSHRVGVPPVVASGAAKEARLDRFLQNELTTALRDRGFLVVERAQLQVAMEQLSIQELTGTERVAELGKMLGAQSLALAQVADAADRLVVTVRVVGVETGDVLGAGSASVRRDDVVTLAAVETRTPGEAAVRSAIAPGWGQAYNGEGVKAVLFGVSTYAGLLTTIGLGVGSGLSWAAYQNLRPGDGLTPEQTSQQAVALRGQTNTLLTATAVAGGLTATAWSLGVVDALLAAPR